MNPSVATLKLLRRLNTLVQPNSSSFGRSWSLVPNKDYSNELISSSIQKEAPLMIARLGATELQCMVNYLGVKQPTKNRSAKKFILNQSPPWWWNESAISQLQNWSGFFPPKQQLVEKFCQMMIDDLKKVDILGSWLKEESFFQEELRQTKRVVLEDLEPFFASKPWTWELKNKRVLVVHPFALTIERQYKNRQHLFSNGLLPDFQLETIQAVQSIASEETRFADWFQALDFMKEQISTRDFDVCILGCGAYGFPLAAHVKEMGRKAIHLGGATQLLFGIKGSRWENFVVYPYANLFNEHWVRPSQDETPKRAIAVENACYW